MSREGTASEEAAFDAVQLERMARQLYTHGPWLIRKMMHFRIRICPYERLVVCVPANSSVLDVGCGGGLLLALLACCGRLGSGVGFDASGPAIQTARRMQEKLQEFNKSAPLRFLHLNVGDPWPAGQFDVVSLIDVLHHISPANQRAVFETAADKVKPGGLLLYKDMADHPFAPALLNRLHDLALARQWIHYVPANKVESWAAEARLVSAHSEAASRLWYRHYLRVFKKEI
jgi:2-polyprenyl-3-methyl-5-hydroxy-6-metoxy-1,4-benzoquinol methylase